VIQAEFRIYDTIRNVVVETQTVIHSNYTYPSGFTDLITIYP
jgi:hypothetical protein